MARPTDKRWKGHLIDWPTIEAMDAEDYELKPLNQQQVAILLMLLEYQKWETRWTNLELSKDELEKFIGDIEIRLMMNEGSMATKDDIRDGMYEAMNRLAAQIVSGRYTDIAIDEDGNVTQPSEEGGAAGLPEDDPTTPLDETAMAIYGGCQGVASGLNLFFDKLDAYYGITNGSPATALATAQFAIKAYFPNDGAAMDTAIATYYTYRGSNNRILFDNTIAFIRYLYCSSPDEVGFNRWLIDLSGYDATKQGIVHDLAIGLSQEFWDSYYASGAKTPSGAYADATCVPVPPFSLINMVFGTGYLSPQMKAFHRFQCHIEGYYVDNIDGDIQDTLYYVTAAGVITYYPAGITITYGTGVTLPTTSQVPYRTDHKYDFTLDLPSLDAGFLTWRHNRHANMNAGSLTPTNGFQMNWVDVGLPV